MPRNSAMFWKVRASPIAARLGADSPSMGSPKKRTEPLLGL